MVDARIAGAHLAGATALPSRTNTNSTANLAVNHIVHSQHHMKIRKKDQEEAELLEFAVVALTLSVALALVVRSVREFSLC